MSAGIDDKLPDGNRPLTRAADEGDIDAVRDLLAKGAKVNSRGRSGYGALALAAKRGDVDIVQLLLDSGARIDAKNNGATPLLEAARFGSLECVKLLVGAGAKKDVITPGGHSAVCQAYMGHRGETVLYLLEQEFPMGKGFPGTRKQLIQWAEKEIKAGRR